MGEAFEAMATAYRESGQYQLDKEAAQIAKTTERPRKEEDMIHSEVLRVEEAVEIIQKDPADRSSTDTMMLTSIMRDSNGVEAQRQAVLIDTNSVLFLLPKTVVRAWKGGFAVNPSRSDSPADMSVVEINEVIIETRPGVKVTFNKEKVMVSTGSPIVKEPEATRVIVAGYNRLTLAPNTNLSVWKGGFSVNH